MGSFERLEGVVGGGVGKGPLVIGWGITNSHWGGGGAPMPPTVVVAQTSFWGGLKLWGGDERINCRTDVHGYWLFLVAAGCLLHIPLERPEATWSSNAYH